MDNEEDLKELEKFGFRYNDFVKCWTKEGRNMYLDEQATYYVTQDRQLQINTYEGDYTLDSFIYDLIQAGIVEKVSDR